MSGHSKWAQIKHKKAITDQKRGQIFGKLVKNIAVSARDNPDPKTNMRLKSAIDQARAVNMPNDNIERVLKKIRDRSQAQFYELSLEAFGPGGVALIISVITDNKNRTISDLRLLLSRTGGRLADEGSVIWMFKKLGVVNLDMTAIPQAERDDTQLKVLRFPVLDIVDEADCLRILTNPEDLYSVKNSLDQIGLHATSVSLEYIPPTTVALSEPATKETLEKLLDALDENDDVQNVFSNEQS